MSSDQSKQFFYGGQAVLEGVMMRGAHKAAVAVRDPNGEIQIHEEPLSAAIYRSRFTRTPFIRGLVGLWDALGLGTKALMWSANIALMEGTYYRTSFDGQEGWVRFMSNRMNVDGNTLILDKNTEAPLLKDPGIDGKEIGKVKNVEKLEIKQVQEEESEDFFSGVTTTLVVVASLGFGIGLFFLLPAAVSTGVGKLLEINSVVFKNAIEEVIKVSLFLGYLTLIAQMEDVKRLFRYHGAEHKTINAYEAGAELVPETVQTYPIEHPRCGTAFLLNVIILSMIINSIIGRPSNFLALAALRISVIPLVAGTAYEWLRFTAKHVDHPLIGILIKPNLALQHMTTREPDLEMVDVAIKALERVLAAEGIMEDAPEKDAKILQEAVPAEA